MQELPKILLEPFERFELAVGECFEFITQEQNARVRFETADYQKGEFLVIVARELRDSTNLIALSLERLRTGNLDESTINAALSSINRAVERHFTLVAALNDVSHISRAKSASKLQERNNLPGLSAS